MSWEQHRYAVERAARLRREFADQCNEASQGVNLRGEANGSIGFLQSKEFAEAFQRDFTAACLALNNVSLKYSLPKPVLALPHDWETVVRRTIPNHAYDVLYYAGGTVRFGIVRQVTVLV